MNGTATAEKGVDNLGISSNEQFSPKKLEEMNNSPATNTRKQSKVANSETSSTTSSVSTTPKNYLGSMLKNDLGEVLRRSSRERRSSSKYADDPTSTSPKSPSKDGVWERKRLRERSRSFSEIPLNKDKKVTRNSASESKEKKQKLEEAKTKQRTQNGDSTTRSSGNVISSKDPSSINNTSSTVTNSNEHTKTKKKMKRKHIFKGSTYAMSVHGPIKRKRGNKKVTERYKHLNKKRLDDGQTDDTSKSSSIFDNHPSDDSTTRKLSENELDKRIANEDKMMPVLIQTVKVANSKRPINDTIIAEPPVLEKQVISSPKSLQNQAVSAKKSSEMCSPFILPFPVSEDRGKMVTDVSDPLDPDNLYPSLCTCRSAEGCHILSRMRPGTYCEGVDCIDGRLIGCVNINSSVSVFRPSVRVPFHALCELHRHRLRFHQSCPGCGLFCTQGTFIQCRASPKNTVHHCHKDCLMKKDGVDACPHCGESSHLQVVHLELNAPKSTSVYQTQQLPFRREPGARIAFTRGHEYKELPVEEDQSLPSKSCKIGEKGTEISSVGLPAGPERYRLENVIDHLSDDKMEKSNVSAINMYNAAKSGDVEKILQLLMFGLDVNTKFESSEKQTALHVASANGQLMLVHVLIQAGAAINAMDSNLLTSLMLAIENGHVPVAQYLIKAGAQLDARGEDAMTALHFAAKYGHTEICRLIVDTGKVSINLQDDGGWTSIIWACEFKHVEVVKFLLERGADPNSIDKEQNVALHWSAFSGSLEISEMLLNRGCDINAKNEHGDTPLHVAARQDKYECVMLFLARNADVDCLNKENETPLMCCEDVNSQIYMALSMSKHLKKISSSSTNKSEVVLYNDISRGKEQNPIQCVNGVDNEATPNDFLYIMDNCETSTISMDRLITSLQSCQCEDNCSSSSCACSSMSIRCWYTKTGRLIDEFNFLDPPMIFECNRGCKCWTSCNNRVLQNGITCRLQLFRTKDKGWGVRTLKDISKGTFICEYVGEVISDLEADRREDDSYLFDLDNKDGESYCIDARFYGNISRFINHSCEPNLVPVKIFVDYQDLRFPRIALFSARFIKAHEELGFDYGCKFWIIKCRSFTCGCASEKCKYSARTIQTTLDNYNRRLIEEQAD